MSSSNAPLTSVAHDNPIGEAERLRRFGAAIDAIRARVEAEVGEEDVAYIRRMRGFSQAAEVPAGCSFTSASSR
jgi:hypothetical protein